MEKVVYFHMDPIGDLMFSLPAIKSLRDSFPQVSSFSVIKPYLAELLQFTGLVDGIIYKKNIFSLVSVLRNRQFDLGIFFSQSPRSLLTGYLAGIPTRIGFAGDLFSSLLTKRIKRYGVPSTQNNLRLIESAGAKITKRDYCGLIKLDIAKSKKIEKLLQATGITPEKGLVVLSAGVAKRRKEKQWPEDSFAHLADMLISTYNIMCIFTGTKDDIEMVDRIQHLAKNRLINFAGKTTLLELAALYLKAKLFIGVDSGAMHLAAALGLPVVAIFGPTDPTQIGPQGEGHSVIKKNNIREITPEEVFSICTHYL